MNRIHLPPHHESIWLYSGGDAERVITAGRQDLILFNPQNPQKVLNILLVFSFSQVSLKCTDEF